VKGNEQGQKFTTSLTLKTLRPQQHMRTVLSDSREPVEIDGPQLGDEVTAATALPER